MNVWNLWLRGSKERTQFIVFFFFFKLLISLFLETKNSVLCSVCLRSLTLLLFLSTIKTQMVEQGMFLFQSPTNTLNTFKLCAMCNYKIVIVIDHLNLLLWCQITKTILETLPSSWLSDKNVIKTIIAVIYFHLNCPLFSCASCDFFCVYV